MAASATTCRTLGNGGYGFSLLLILYVVTPRGPRRACRACIQGRRPALRGDGRFGSCLHCMANSLVSEPAPACHDESMKSLAIKVLVNGVGLWVASYLVRGIHLA